MLGGQVDLAVLIMFIIIFHLLFTSQQKHFLKPFNVHKSFTSHFCASSMMWQIGPTAQTSCNPWHSAGLLCQNHPNFNKQTRKRLKCQTETVFFHLSSSAWPWNSNKTSFQEVVWNGCFMTVFHFQHPEASVPQCGWGQLQRKCRTGGWDMRPSTFRFLQLLQQPRISFKCETLQSGAVIPCVKNCELFIHKLIKLLRRYQGIYDCPSQWGQIVTTMGTTATTPGWW